MLKQSPGRNQRSKGFKVKHVLQICLLLAIGIWLLNQLKHSYDEKKAYDYADSKGKISEKVQGDHDIAKLGRKDLHPLVEETALEIDGQGDKEELEEEIEEIKPEEIEDEGRGGGDDEIDGHDQERAEEEETEEVEDLIDVDDREREEGSEEKASQLEDASSIVDHAQNGGKRNFREAREENYKGDDASSSVEHNTQTISNEFEIRGLRKVKEKEVENAKVMELEQQSKDRSIKKVSIETIDSNSKVGNKVTFEYGDEGNYVHEEKHGDEYNLSNLSDARSDSSPLTDAVPNEKPEVKFNSRLMIAETSGFLNGTGTLPELIHDPNASANGKHTLSKAVAGAQKRIFNRVIENRQSNFMTDNLDAVDTDFQLATVSKSTVPERILKLDALHALSEQNSTLTTINENNGKVNSEDSESILSEAAENAEESSEDIDATQNGSFGSSDSSSYQEDREDSWRK